MGTTWERFSLMDRQEFRGKIEEIVKYNQTRCDCDDYARCYHCILNQKINWIRHQLIKELYEVEKPVSKQEKVND